MPSLLSELRAKPPSPYINRFLSADTIVPGYANPQNLNRYSYVVNNPLRFIDPTGHRYIEDEFEGSLSYVEDKMTEKWRAGNKKRRLEAELRNLTPSGPACSGSNQSVICLPASESELELPLTLQTHPGAESSYGGYSNTDLDALYLYWEKILMPFNDILSAEDIYRMTSTGGWRASRNALNLGILEAIAQGARQAHRDSWYQTLTPTQRLLRPIVAGAEALATDGISGLVGSGYAVAGFAVGGPPGAFAGQLAGATYATHTMDSFWTGTFNSNVLNFLGAWP